MTEKWPARSRAVLCRHTSWRKASNIVCENNCSKSCRGIEVPWLVCPKIQPLAESISAGGVGSEIVYLTHKPWFLFVFKYKLTINWDGRCLIEHQKQTAINIEVAVCGGNAVMCGFIYGWDWGVADSLIVIEMMDTNTDSFLPYILLNRTQWEKSELQ